MTGVVRAHAAARAGGGLLLLFPVVLLFVLSWQKSYTGDEGLTVQLASGPYRQLIENVGADFHMPGYHTLLWAISHLAGSSLLVMRLLSLALVLLMLILAARSLPLPAAVLLALSPFTLHLALEVRMYGLLALCGLLTMMAWQGYERAGSGRSLFALALSLALGTWVHYFAWTCTAAVVLGLAIERRWKQALVVLCLVLLLFLPWAGRALERVSSGQEALPAGVPGLEMRATPAGRLLGAPFSIAGTALRFAAGNAVFDFGQWGIRQLTLGSVAGGLLGLALLFLAVRGIRRSSLITKLLALVPLVALSLVRPSARHFAMAYPAYMVLAAEGLPSGRRARTALVACLSILMILLCVPYVSRSTIPQRSTHDRDFLEVARLSDSLRVEEPVPLVIFLDTYSTLGISRHLLELGFPDSLVWHPHMQRFGQERFFCSLREGLAYLQMDTDSLVGVWLGLAPGGGGFLLVANRPDTSRSARAFGSGENLFSGLGSDVMADLDLMEALAVRVSVQEIDLRGSEGPMGLFLCRPPAP
ncbi:hypothetical protein JW921_07950 [Candidatus Fermentibacterales bacterium]|nr:hypothetical protein [Candidatus Fermentibacterales bacterium]